MKIPDFIKNNLLLKVTSANTMLVFVRMVFSLFSQKAIAVLLGTEGIAVVGYLKNVMGFLEKFSILGTSNGLVKYISKYKNDKKQLNSLFSTAFIFSGLATLFSFMVFFFFSKSLNDIVFGADKDYTYVFKILSLIVPFMGVNAVLNSLLNGLSAYKSYSKVTIITIITSTFFLVFLTFYIGLEGALFAISIVPLFQFLSYMVFFSKDIKPYLDFRKMVLDLSFKNQLLSYSLMTVFVVFFINLTEIAVRNLIESNISISEAGNWTAMNSISRTYMQFSAAIFPMYILPQYAKINDTFDFRKEVKKVYKMLLPLIIIGMLIVFLLKNVIIRLLYSEEFLGMAVLFKWQLMGDLVKFVALVIAYQFLAKRQIAYFLFTELLSVFLFYIFSVYLVEFYGTEGVVMAHFFRYVIYFIVVLYILRHNFIGKNRKF